MYLKEEGSSAPESKRVDEQVSAQIKVKNGEFTLYNRETKEKTEELKTLKIVPINSSRFTIKASEGVAGEYVFSGTYRSPKQKITVMKSSNGSTKKLLEGSWQDIKDQAKAMSLKYTKLLYCLIEQDGEWVKGILDLQGISAIQWSQLVLPGAGNSVTLKISDEKNFETSGKKFYSVEVASTESLEDESDAIAYAQEVEEFFKSEDARYEFYKDEVTKDEEVEEGPKDGLDAEFPEEDINPEDIPFK